MNKKIISIGGLLIFLISLFPCFVLASWDESLNNGLVAYYNFNESSGDLIDAYRGLYNGTLSGPTQGISGKIGDAYNFDGVNDYITLTTTNNFQVNETNSWTVSMWIKMDNYNGWQSFFGTNGVDQFSFVGYRTDNNTLLFGNGGGDYIQTSSGNHPMDTGTWYHLIALRNGTTNALIISDNLTIATGTLSNSIGNLNISLGRKSDGSYLNATMDELAIWNRTLTESEISNLYNNGNGITYIPTYSGNYTITFNLTDADTGEQIDTSSPKDYFDIVCDNGFSANNEENPYTSEETIPAGVTECTFSDLNNYYSETKNITITQNTTIEIPMSPSTVLSQEEHDWIEAIYNCLINGVGCA